MLSLCEPKGYKKQPDDNSVDTTGIRIQQAGWQQGTFVARHADGRVIATSVVRATSCSRHSQRHSRLSQAPRLSVREACLWPSTMLRHAEQ